MRRQKIANPVVVLNFNAEGIEQLAHRADVDADCMRGHEVVGAIAAEFSEVLVAGDFVAEKSNEKFSVRPAEGKLLPDLLIENLIRPSQQPKPPPVAQDKPYVLSLASFLTACAAGGPGHQSGSSSNFKNR
jgi:hypothetical protein